MDFRMTEEQELLLEGLRELMDRECSEDYIKLCDAEGRPPVEFYKALVDNGYGLLGCPESVGGTPVDNLDAGGLCAPLDLTTGCVTQPAGDKRGGCFPRHPVTGTQIPGFCLPDWQAAKTMVLEAAQQVPGLGYCGWDVCFLPDRPALMEGNAYPSHALVQMQVHRSADGLGL